MREHLEGLFPKVCGNCHRRYATLREYLLKTDRVGPAIPYDVELGNWKPLTPIGTVTLSNCACGSSMALSSSGMPLPQLWSLLDWARIETRKRKLTARELLNYLRDELREQVLTVPDAGAFIRDLPLV
jgi:hypothetical protein